MRQFSEVVKTLDSRTSLELEAQTVAALQSTATQLASASHRQPIVHERVLQTPDYEAPVLEPCTTEPSSGTLDKDEFSPLDGNSMEKETAQSEDIDSNVHPNRLPDYGSESNIPSVSDSKWDLRSYERWSLVNDACWTKFPQDSGETPTTDQDDTPFEDDFATASSKIKSNLNFTRSFTNTSPWKARFRVRLAVDIVDTRFSFGTETSGFQSQSSVQSTALRMEVSSRTKSIPELSTSSTPQLDKAVEAPSLWGKLWGTLTSLF
jgi:hypothetical protein